MKIKIIKQTNCYTTLKVGNKIHIVPTNGWFPLQYWIDYFNKRRANKNER